MTRNAIDVTGLRKAFGDKQVLDGIDLAVPAGSIFALLGPDGAGPRLRSNAETAVATLTRGVRKPKSRHGEECFPARNWSAPAWPDPHAASPRVTGEKRP